MKLYRFTAMDTQSAIYSAHEALGSEALIYSTRRVLEGIEVLAGLPAYQDEPSKKVKGQVVEVEKLPAPAKAKVTSAADARIMDSFKIQLQNMNDKLQQLTLTIDALQQLVAVSLDKKSVLSKVAATLKKWFPKHKHFKEGFYGRK